jgi:signal peptidase I
MDLWGEEGKLHSIPITGNSMFPLIQNGDRVLVSHVHSDIRPGDIIVFWQDGRLLIHRVIRVSGESTSPAFFTKGDNAQGFDFPSTVQEMIGKVVAIERGQRRISLDTTNWRFAGRLIAVTVSAGARLAEIGSGVKRTLLGPRPVRVITFLRQSISIPFAFVYKVLLKMLSHWSE